MFLKLCEQDRDVVGDHLDKNLSKKKKNSLKESKSKSRNVGLSSRDGDVSNHPLPSAEDRTRAEQNPKRHLEDDEEGSRAQSMAKRAKTNDIVGSRSQSEGESSGRPHSEEQVSQVSTSKRRQDEEPSDDDGVAPKKKKRRKTHESSQPSKERPNGAQRVSLILLSASALILSPRNRSRRIRKDGQMALIARLKLFLPTAAKIATDLPRDGRTKGARDPIERRRKRKRTEQTTKAMQAGKAVAPMTGMTATTTTKKKLAHQRPPRRARSSSTQVKSWS